MTTPHKEKVTVIGAGGFGTALALVLNRNGHDVSVWGFDPRVVSDIAEKGENHIYLPGVHPNRFGGPQIAKPPPKTPTPTFSPYHPSTFLMYAALSTA